MQRRLYSMCATLTLAAALVAFTGCDDDDPLAPSTGGGTGGADIDVTSATPTSGNTNISGSA